MADFVSGKNTSFRLQWNQSVWGIYTKTWSIEEVAVEAEDGVNGEQRDRLQKITKYYRCLFDCYDDGSSQTLQNLIINQTNDDNYNPQLPLAGGVLFNYQNQTRAAFVLNGCSMGPLKVSGPGRTERIMHALSFRAQYFATVPAA